MPFKYTDILLLLTAVRVVRYVTQVMCFFFISEGIKGGTCSQEDVTANEKGRGEREGTCGDRSNLSNPKRRRLRLRGAYGCRILRRRRRLSRRRIGASLPMDSLGRRRGLETSCDRGDGWGRHG